MRTVVYRGGNGGGGGSSRYRECPCGPQQGWKVTATGSIHRTGQASLSFYSLPVQLRAVLEPNRACGEERGQYHNRMLCLSSSLQLGSAPGQLPHHGTSEKQTLNCMSVTVAGPTRPGHRQDAQTQRNKQCPSCDRGQGSNLSHTTHYATIHSVRRN